MANVWLLFSSLTTVCFLILGSGKGPESRIWVPFIVPVSKWGACLVHPSGPYHLWVLYTDTLDCTLIPWTLERWIKRLGWVATKKSDYFWIFAILIRFEYFGCFCYFLSTLSIFLGIGHNSKSLGIIVNPWIFFSAHGVWTYKNAQHDKLKEKAACEVSFEDRLLPSLGWINVNTIYCIHSFHFLPFILMESLLIHDKWQD